MSRKFILVPLSGCREDADVTKTFELGFSGFPITASDKITRTNAHYIYEPRLIASEINGVHVGYMWVESLVDGVAIAHSAFGKHEFIEVA